MDEGDENAEREPEHGAAGLLEFQWHLARVLKGLLALLGECDDFGQKDDVLAVQLHARGVDLETVVGAMEAGVEGFHGVHFAFSRGGLGGAFCC